MFVTTAVKASLAVRIIAAATAVGAAVLPQSEASAVSARVKVACASDYFAHCSSHAVGSPGLRQCMRSVGSGLSRRCINALVADGEVSKSEVDRRSASLR